MTIDQIIELEIKVQEMIAALIVEIAEAEKHAAPPGQLDGTEGRLSRQDSLLNHEIGKEAQRRRHLRLRLLHDAVKRMDEGSYGTCQNCGKEIDYSRLDLQPETAICGDCAK